MIGSSGEGFSLYKVLRVQNLDGDAVSKGCLISVDPMIAIRDKECQFAGKGEELPGLQWSREEAPKHMAVLVENGKQFLPMTIEMRLCHEASWTDILIEG